MKKKEELLATTKLRYKDGVIIMKYLESVKDMDDNFYVAKKMTKKVVKMVEKKKIKKVKILIDLLELGGRGYLPRKSRQEYSKITKIPGLYKVAIAGGNAHLKTVINFIVTLIRKKKFIHFFNIKEEAIEWLNK